jgi:hypothetical protein
MVAALKVSIKINDATVPKGTTGIVIGVSNSKKMVESYPDVEYKLGEWYYLVQFPDCDKTLLDRSQIDLN